MNVILDKIPENLFSHFSSKFFPGHDSISFLIKNFFKKLLSKIAFSN